jgi:hypothetical protein
MHPREGRASEIADGGMHARARIRREGRDSGRIDADNTGKAEGCMPEYASIGMD